MTATPTATSITAHGNCVRRGGKEIVESLSKVVSVDCVAQPATVAGLYESKGTPVKLKIKVLAKRLKESRPGYAKALREMAEAGIMGPDAAMPEPAPAPAEAPPEEPEAADHMQALNDAAHAVLDDGALSPKEKLQKIKEIFKLMGAGEEKATPGPDFGGEGAGGDVGGDDDSDSDGSDSEDEDVSKKEESVKAKLSRLALMEAKERLRAAADEAKVTLPKTLLDEINPRITEARCKALVAELRGAAPRGQQPRSATPAPAKVVTESKDEAPEGREQLREWLKGR
jgi:hypothetical protein